MKLGIKNDFLKYALLVLFVMASRLPFLGSGYGLDGDAWSVAISAEALNETGVYAASRLPGFPLHEYLCSWFIGFGFQGLNLISAIFSVIAVLFFALSLRVMRFKNVFLASIAFAMVPSFYINSTVTIDYVIALAFIMCSLFFLLRGNPVTAGIFIGLAVGARITSGAMLVPFSILLLANDGLRKNVIRIMKLSVPAIIVSLLLFIPVLKTYGTDFFTYYNVPYPSIPKVLYKMSFEVWGVIGFLGIIIATAMLFLPNWITARRFLFPRAINEKHVIAWLVAVDIYIIAFLKLPMESGYLIPIIPFLIFIFGKYLFDLAFRFFCLMLIASAFACTISPLDRYDAVQPSAASLVFHVSGEQLNFDLLKGPVLSFEERRKNGILFVDSLLASTDTLSGKSVIVAGRWFNQMVVQCADTSKLKAEIRDYISEEEADKFYSKDYKIYYLPKQDYYNIIMRNTDLEVYGAIPYLERSRE